MFECVCGGGVCVGGLDSSLSGSGAYSSFSALQLPLLFLYPPFTSPFTSLPVSHSETRQRRCERVRYTPQSLLLRFSQQRSSCFPSVP